MHHFIPIPENVTVAQSGLVFLEMQKSLDYFRDKSVQWLEEIDRLNREAFHNSIRFEQMKKNYNNMLTDFEGRKVWEESIEHCCDYIEQAQFAEKMWGRKENCIAIAQEWFNENK